MASLFERTLLAFLLLIPLTSAAEVPTLDPTLEKRLTSTSSYRTREKDTLKSIAHVVYGHKSWWTKLQQENSKLSEFGPDQRLPKKTAVRYRIPVIGSTYVVQPNDWLIRILLWKYGEADSFNEYLLKNSERMAKTNLIEPGNQLAFEDDGTIRNVGNGQILIQGIKNLKTGLRPQGTSSEDTPAVSNVISDGQDSQDSQGSADSSTEAKTEAIPIPGAGSYSDVKTPDSVGAPGEQVRSQILSEQASDDQITKDLENYLKGISIGILALFLLYSLWWMSRTRTNKSKESPLLRQKKLMDDPLLRQMKLSDDLMQRQNSQVHHLSSLHKKQNGKKKKANSKKIDGTTSLEYFIPRLARMEKKRSLKRKSA